MEVGMTKNIYRALCILTILAAAACDGAIDDAANVIKSPDIAPGDPLALDGDVISCVTGDDCAVVELGCCDHCNGGFAVAVNVEYETEVAERNAEACGPDEVCTEMACAELYPKCDDGECIYVDEIATDWQACGADSDCVVVELGCCDHCNGGRVTAVNKEFEDEAREEMADECEADHPCTLMACAEEIAACEDGQCTHHPDPDFGP
jgi:hypothetical protein